MIRRCIACHREDDLANLEPTYEYIHRACLPWWERFRSLPPSIFSIVSGAVGEKWIRGAAVALAVAALVLLAAR